MQSGLLISAGSRTLPRREKDWSSSGSNVRWKVSLWRDQPVRECGSEGSHQLGHFGAASLLQILLSDIFATPRVTRYFKNHLCQKFSSLSDYLSTSIMKHAIQGGVKFSHGKYYRVEFGVSFNFQSKLNDRVFSYWLWILSSFPSNFEFLNGFSSYK